MEKKSIAVYDDSRTPLGLGMLKLQRGWYVEDIFDAVKESEDFGECEAKLRQILAEPVVVEDVKENRLTLTVNTAVGIAHLRVKVQ